MNSTLNIAKLVAVCDRIDGRKKLQKIVHILQSCGFKSDFPHQFGYLHYGPYSHEVKADIDVLVGPAGVVQEEECTSVSGLKSFVYQATPSLRNALEGGATPWTLLALNLNKKPAQDLEAMSTILFLKSVGVSEVELHNRFLQLKPALGSKFETAQDAVSQLQRTPSTS